MLHYTILDSCAKLQVSKVKLKQLWSLKKRALKSPETDKKKFGLGKN